MKSRYFMIMGIMLIICSIGVISASENLDNISIDDNHDLIEVIPDDELSIDEVMI